MPLKDDWAEGDWFGADDANDVASAVNTLETGAAATDAAVAGKADKTRTITAGTGLSGGGDLTADRTLAVAYGTTAGTAAQGNDARLSDARTPTAHVHPPTLQTTASSATPTPAVTSPSHQMTVTALAAGATFAAPTGTVADGYKLMLRVKDNGTARTLAFNAIYRAIGVTLPTTTVANKTLYIGCIYNAADTKWDVIAVGAEA